MEKKKIYAYIINQFLDMPPKAISKRSPRTPRQRRPRPVATKATVALIKKTVMKIAETKEYRGSLSIVPLLHNTPTIISTNLLRCQIAPVGSVNFIDPRVGDSIQCQGISFRFLFMTYSDRPNVTFKVWVIKAPAYSPVSGVSPYTYAGWFIDRTNQWVLDTINNTQVTVVKSMTFKPPVSDTSQEADATLHETSFARTMWVPWKKTVVYQEQGASPSLEQPKNYSLQLMCAAYDTYGTLITDFAGKMLIQHSMHFKDF